jgi:endogenous inhibitor of DNA gyrase (YacG/DUF329 family)
MTTTSARRRKVLLLRCPMCGVRILYRRGEALPPEFPFCSDRCKNRDLYRWLNEEYVLGRELTPDELEHLDPADASAAWDVADDDDHRH